MSRRKWRIGETYGGFRHPKTPEGTVWIPSKRNEKGVREWKLVELRTFEQDMNEMPILIQPKENKGSVVKRREGGTWVSHVSEALDKKGDTERAG